MNTKQLSTLAAAFLAICYVLLQGTVPPKPEPLPPVPVPNVTAQARESVRAYALMLATNCREAQSQFDENAAYEFLAPKNEAGRKEAFREWGRMIDQAENWRQALEDSAAGFAEAAK